MGGANGLPAGATGAVLSLTVTEPDAANFVTAYPCGQAVPGTSSINMGPNETRTNTVVVGLDASSRVCFYSVVPTHLVVDVMATFGQTGSMSGLRFEAENPTRLLDTRTLARPVPIQGVQPIPSFGALAFTVTSTQAAGNGYLTVFDCCVRGSRRLERHVPSDPHPGERRRDPLAGAVRAGEPDHPPRGGPHRQVPALIGRGQRSAVTAINAG